MAFRLPSATLAAAIILMAPAALAAESQTITGTLTTVDDAGYPMYSIGVTPKDGKEFGMLLNNEAATLEKPIEEMKGKAVTVDYTVAPDVSVIDVTADGKSIAFANVGADQRPARTPDLKSITGTLSGAAEPTASDLPDEVTVTAKDGQTVTFEWYVDDVMAKSNGKEVTLDYEMSTRTDATSIKLVK
jgi:hypothetical protein